MAEQTMLSSRLAPGSDEERQSSGIQALNTCIECVHMLQHVLLQTRERLESCGKLAAILVGEGCHFCGLSSFAT